jgi:hypothetical protein
MGPTEGGYNFSESIVKLSALVVACKLAQDLLMQQIADWLDKLGMFRVRSAFCRERHRHRSSQRVDRHARDLSAHLMSHLDSRLARIMA